MAGNPREHAQDRGFWDGGGAGHGSNRESGGKSNSFPGSRKPRRVGVNTDIEFPPEKPAEKQPKT